MKNKTRDSQRHPTQGPFLARLFARASFTLLADSSLSPRRHGCQHIAYGLVILATWFLLLGVFATLVGREPPDAGAGLDKAPVIGGAFKKLCGIMVMLLFFPAGWAAVKILIGVFQVMTGIRFREVNDRWNGLPIWGKLLSLPVILVIFVPSVAVVFLGILMPVIWVYQQVAQ